MMETVGESTRKSIFVKNVSQTSSDRAPETIVISNKCKHLKNVAVAKRIGEES